MLAMTAAAFAADRKIAPPISHQMVTVKLPPTSEATLSNGLKLLIVEDARFPLVWARFYVDGAGILYSRGPGVAEITAEMLDKGTKQRNAKQIAEDAARFGATVQSSARLGNRESAIVAASGLSAHFEDWMELSADVLTNPSFSPDQFNSQVARIRTQIHLEMGEPKQVAQNALMRMLYGSHPGGEAVAPLPALDSLTPRMAADWHRERYAPANTVLTIIGRVGASAARSAVEKLLASWKTPAPAFSLPPEPVAPEKRRIQLIDRPGAPQTRIEIGNLLFPSSHPDHFAMILLDHVLGGAGDARLESMLEAMGQAVSANTWTILARYTGCWGISAGVRTEFTAQALGTILAEIQRLCDEAPSADELSGAKSSVTGRFALTLEQPSQVINDSYQRLRYGYSTDYWDNYPARINAVTAAEVRAVARKYYDPARAQIAVAGDAAKIRRDLEKFGPVEA